jgi:hypothetical protein
MDNYIPIHPDSFLPQTPFDQVYSKIKCGIIFGGKCIIELIKSCNNIVRNKLCKNNILRCNLSNCDTCAWVYNYQVNRL